MSTAAASGVRDAAYQGSPGAYSEEAAWALLGPEATLLPCASLRHVFAAVAGGLARHAVVPVENSLAGVVPDALDLLLAQDRPVVGETLGRIDHVLIASHGTALGDVRRVLSHPVALAQCTSFFDRHPAIEPVPVFDTAGAVALVLRDAERRTAAIASRRAATVHGAAVLLDAVQDHDANWTRFLLLGPAAAAPSPPVASRKAMLAFRLSHVPGALWRALEPFARRGLSVTRIESRPIHGEPFEYLFFADVLAERPGEALEAACHDLARVARWTRVLGIFAAPTPRESTTYKND
jgi:prephenate dehydratase